MSKLLLLREWLAVPEVAQYLSSVLEEVVSEAKVLRLALDGHLSLSVYLPRPTNVFPASITSINDEQNRGFLIKNLTGLPKDNSYLKIWKDNEIEQVQGIFGLPMIFGERLAIEAECLKVGRGIRFCLPATNHIVIERGDKLFCLQIASTRAIYSAGQVPLRIGEEAVYVNAIDFPTSAILAVRSPALRKFEESKAFSQLLNAKPSSQTFSSYSTAWLTIQQHAIAEFFSPRRNPDAKRGEVVEWIKQKCGEANLPYSENVATTIFTIIKPANHDTKKKRVEPLD